jgi:hypothetical protein
MDGDGIGAIPAKVIRQFPVTRIVQRSTPCSGCQ